MMTMMAVMTVAMLKMNTVINRMGNEQQFFHAEIGKLRSQPSEATVNSQALALAPEGEGVKNDASPLYTFLPPRRLENVGHVALYSASTATAGCVLYQSTGNTDIDLATKACNSNRCPPCWIFTDTTNQLTLANCATAYISNQQQQGVASTLMEKGLMEYTFINMGSGNAVISSVTEGSNDLTLTEGQVRKAYCWSVPLRTDMGNPGTESYLYPLTAGA